MKNLIYYPNFESRDLEWLKFALIYLDSFSPIIPDTGDRTLSDLYKKLQNKTDLLKLHRPEYNEESRATRNAIEYITKVLENPHSFAEELKSVNAVRDWKNPAMQNYTLFSEKYVGEWKYFCKKHSFIQDTNSGLLISKNLGELYMTFLAQEVAYENEASPITDKKELDELSIAIRTKNIKEDNKIEVAKNIINKQLPLDFSQIDIDKIIEIRNKSNFKQKQNSFHNELNNLYESVGKAIDPSEFIDSYDRTLKDWTNELSQYGIGLIVSGLSAYILIENKSATDPEYIKQILESGLVLFGGITLVKNINKGTDRKYCRQYLSEIGNIK